MELNSNIIFSNNGYGLTKDSKILVKYLDQASKDFKDIKFKVRAVNFYSYQTGYVDINFFLEIPNPILIHYAKINILIPNSEWFYESWIPYLDQFDYIWCKTYHSKKIFSKYVSENKLILIGWTSLDCLDTKISKENKYIHIAGKSEYKGTQQIIDCWSKDLPKLTILYHSNKIKTKEQDNIVYINKIIPENEINKLKNENYIHLCLSNAEGYGHYINETLSCKNIVLTIDSPPMNQFVDKIFLVKKKATSKIPFCLDEKVYFCEEDLKKKINLLKDIDFEKIGNQNRNYFLSSIKLFRKNIKQNFSLLIKRLKNNEFLKKIPREITSSTEDLPTVSIITLTHNRPEFYYLMEANYLGIDYPREKLEWIIIDDSDTDELKSKIGEKNQCKYIYLNQKTSIGFKRNIAIKNSNNSLIAFMDDDDIYYPRNILLRYSYLKYYNKQCCYCSTIGCFDINNIISHINVPPFQLGFNQRVSEASLMFYKDFWVKQKFLDINNMEGESFLDNRYNECIEINWENIFLSLIHKKNISNRIVLNKESNGCHFGLSEELFKYLTNLQK